MRKQKRGYKRRCRKRRGRKRRVKINKISRMGNKRKSKKGIGE